MATATSAAEALCRFAGRTSDTMADLLDRYLASEEIVGDETAPEPTGEAFTALLRARVAFAHLPRVQQLAFMRRLALEYGYAQMQAEASAYFAAKYHATTPTA
jgi:DNA-directed RNA polymerase specialized sigma24 family protein